MIPIQTILALLAFLMMVGCSQKAPPGSPPKQDRNAIATHNNGDGNPTHVKPGDSPAPNTPPAPAPTFKVEVDQDKKTFNLVFFGAEGKDFYDATLVKAKKGLKKGFNYICSEDHQKYECKIVVDSVSGNVNMLQNMNEVKSEKFPTTARDVINHDAVSIWAYDPTKAGGPKASIVLIGDVNAQPIFEALQVPTTPVAAGERAGGTYSAGLKKEGAHISCEERPLASDQKTKHYWCDLTLSLDVGAVDLVKKN